MNFRFTVITAAVGLGLGLTWYSDRDTRRLESIADEYAIQTPGFVVGEPYEVPGRIRVFTQPANGAILCDVGAVRLALLDRTCAGCTFSSFSVSSDVPDSQTDVHSAGNVHFGSSYSGGETKCQVHDVPFIYRDGSIHLDGQSFPTITSTLVMIDAAAEVIHVRPGGHAGV